MLVEGYMVGKTTNAQLREVLVRHGIPNPTQTARAIIEGKMVSFETDPYLREDLKELGVFCS